MVINLRNIFSRMQPTQQDIQTLHGVLMAIAEGRKGSAAGGVLNGTEAAALRAVIAEHGEARLAPTRGPVRGLARLLRRNPTDAERALWDGLTRDRRFAGLGFKRATPVGAHITDFVSFSLRLVIDVVPEEETDEAAKTRAHKWTWLAERDYRVVELRRHDVERDVAAVLDTLAAAIGPPDVDPGS
jgi:tRNA/rRNA methyltransferase